MDSVADKAIMNKAVAIALVVLAIFCAGADSYASQGVSPRRAPMSLGDAIRGALGRSPEVKSASLRIVEATANLSFAWSQVFPALSGTLGGLSRKDSAISGSALFGGEVYNQYEVQLRFNQPIFAGGAIKSGIAAARKQIRIRELEHAVSERDVALKVIQAYYGILLVGRRVEALEATAAVRREALVTAEKRMKIGRSQLLEVLQIRTQLALIEPKVAQARNQIHIFTAELASFLGDDSGAKQLEIRDRFESPDWERLRVMMEAAEKRFPELDKARLMVEEIDDERDVRLAKHWPQLNLTGALGRNANMKSDLLDDFSTNWTFGLQLTLPLFSGFSSRYERAALSAQARQLEAQELRAQDQSALDRVRTVKDLELSRAVLDSSQVAVNLAREALVEAKRGYGFSTIDFNQYNTAEANNLEAKLALEQAKHDQILAVARHFAASGISLLDLVSVLEEAR